MDIHGKVAVVTGAGGGIGAALADALVAAGAKVVVADLKSDGVEAVAARLNEATPGSAVAVAGDVSQTAQIERLIAVAEESFGPVDLYFANAGVGGGVTLEASEEDWDLAHQVNVMAHVRAAKLLVPGWIERGQGYFVSTASAAGLLTQIGSATYSVSKHGAVAFAEWLAITYGDQGVAVSCLCPMGVNTDMLTGGAPITNETQRRAAQAVTDAGGVLEADEVAAIVLKAMESEEFLILPHPEVKVFQSRKAGDIDRWIAGMRRYQASLA
ncbi:SDR family oxidoreductase [Aeromicrobium tamlense]|uniref:NAD(P)-dependent dehydrogenase (Short-subunit alcohol dehydrogenase family) n=1 Tax=Aeromicrobium tamlense TaxID=375541 RepID=A0A8I0KM29_9ACTN|nr:MULTISPECIES: SDR family oxidoreductase [Aeromicrobium]MBD1269259.1 SDR family oxidoreductase [Aeromicrobium tamlense]NYI36833.1 NAD(P)-dependent dehydrogenase (short-subunit alcohol dehydrogenase family) [Aeromicrobium tamlense]